MAGVSRLQYSADIELVRVMCSGRVDLEFIFRAFAQGMDGVFVGGCRLNECNYITHGNYRALNTVLLCKQIMAYIGLNPVRLRVGFMSSGEGQVFAELINSFAQQITSLGPLGSSEGLAEAEMTETLNSVRSLIPYIKIVKRTKLAEKIGPDGHEQFYTADEIGSIFREIVSYSIDPEKCRACMICARRCPVQAISGAKNQPHAINQAKCIRCGTCLAACPERFNAVRTEKDINVALGLVIPKAISGTNVSQI